MTMRDTCDGPSLSFNLLEVVYDTDLWKRCSEYLVIARYRLLLIIKIFKLELYKMPQC